MGGRVVVGVDLSGPANHRGTSLVWLAEARGAREIVFGGAISGASDETLAKEIGRLAKGTKEIAIGLDAPLSYNDGGGDRPGDRALRALTKSVALPSGCVMTPTMTRMAYLTLRGIAVARHLVAIGIPASSIVEVHPSMAYALHGAPSRHVVALKSRESSRKSLLDWLGKRGFRGIPPALAANADDVAACGAALAAWRWRRGRAAWVHLASPPAHPFDLAC